MVPLGQSSLRQLKIGLLLDAIAEVIGLLYDSRNASSEVNERMGRKTGLLYSDFLAFRLYSGGKGHVRGETWITSVRTVYPVPDDDGEDLEPLM